MTKIYTAWLYGSPAEEAALDVLPGLWQDRGIKYIHLSFSDGAWCVARIAVTPSSASKRVGEALEETGLTCAPSARRALWKAKQVPDHIIHPFIASSAKASRVIDLMTCDPDYLVQAAVTPALVNVVGALTKAHQFTVQLAESTAPAVMRHFANLSLHWSIQAQCQLPFAGDAHPVENALRPAVIQWVNILLEATSLMPEQGDTDWRDKWARFERRHLGRK